MAMTFTLATHLREQLLQLVNSRIERKEKEEMEKYVDLKLREKETRHLFWDLEYMVKMEA